MPTATTTATVNRARLYPVILAFIEGDKITYQETRATTHAAALHEVRENTTAKVRAFYPPYGVTLPLAAMHVTANTLSGFIQRGAGDVPRQQRQLSAARYALHAMAQHGAKAVTIPHDIQDLFQAAALALINHVAPLATVAARDVQAAYAAAMSAVQKAYRADTRGIQQAAAGKELPRFPGSPTMRQSTPRRAAPHSYIVAIAAIKAAYIAQARDKAAAARVMDYWITNPDCTSVEMAAAQKINQSSACRRMADIRRIANALYPDGVTRH